MIFSRRLLQFLEYNAIEEPIEVSADTTSELMEEELQQDIAHISTIHCDTQEYRMAAENLRIMCEAYEKHERAKTEKEKVRVQYEELKHKNDIDWNLLSPRIIGIAAFTIASIAALGLEQRTPLSMRWLKLIDTLLAPKM